MGLDGRLMSGRLLLLLEAAGASAGCSDEVLDNWGVIVVLLVMSSSLSLLLSMCAAAVIVWLYCNDRVDG